jgi:hypothetical protein
VINLTDEEQMSWNDVADVIDKMADQPPDSDRYLMPAVKTFAAKFIDEMRALRFPVPRVHAEGDGHEIVFEWSKKLRMVITATAADFSILNDE